MNINILRQYWLTILKGVVHKDGFVVWTQEMYYSKETYWFINGEPGSSKWINMKWERRKKRGQIYKLVQKIK